MTLVQTRRLRQLLPNNYPKYVRVYDNGGKTADRYIVVFSGRYSKGKPPQYHHLSMSDNPFHPQGVCILDAGNCTIDVDEKHHRFYPAFGRSNHLGKRIQWHELPEACQTVALQAYKELWDLCPAEAHDGKTQVRRIVQRDSTTEDRRDPGAVAG